MATDFRGYFLDRALVFICHGYGEHCSRYERLGNALAEQGYLAFSQDHGMSHPGLVQSLPCYSNSIKSYFLGKSRWGGGGGEVEVVI